MTRRVVLVVGPPCGGKSTWVAHHAQPDDSVVCFDQLAIQAGSWHHHDHEPYYREVAGHAYEQQLAEVARLEHGIAWVIAAHPARTSAPT